MTEGLKRQLRGFKGSSKTPEAAGGHISPYVVMLRGPNLRLKWAILRLKWVNLGIKWADMKLKWANLRFIWVNLRLKLVK